MLKGKFHLKVLMLLCLSPMTFILIRQQQKTTPSATEGTAKTSQRQPESFSPSEKLQQPPVRKSSAVLPSKGVGSKPVGEDGGDAGDRAENSSSPSSPSEAFTRATADDRTRQRQPQSISPPEKLQQPPLRKSSAVLPSKGVQSKPVGGDGGDRGKNSSSPSSPSDALRATASLSSSPPSKAFTRPTADDRTRQRQPQSFSPSKKVRQPPLRKSSAALRSKVIDRQSLSQGTHLVIKLSDRRVYVYQKKKLKVSYPIAIGKAGWETPTGNYKVMHMEPDPVWEHPWTGEVILNGPKNPLGPRWIAFWTDGRNSIGFHGTPAEKSVGRAASHGCIRMFNKDIIALYAQVKVGTPVTVKP
jgi:lipoprotein-anchoring transpeptidase ErfK/SrfK